MRHKRSYGLEWGVFIVAVAAGLAYTFRMEVRPLVSSVLPSLLGERTAGARELSAGPDGLRNAGRAAAARLARADWFMIMRMPEISVQHESGVETMKVRIDEWLGALAKAGFHPILFSEAVRTVARGGALPERALVLFFSPAYRRTYEIAGPILHRRGVPAAILTNDAEMRLADRRYLNYHTLRLVHEKEGWDTGFFDSVTGFRMNEKDQDLREGKWSAIAGATALNRWRPGAEFNFLTVNADWTAQELVDRLLAETPITGKVRLLKAVIHAKEWGVLPRHLSSRPQAFEIQSAPGNRSTRVNWLSTLGQSDCRIRATVNSQFGDLWLQFRFDEATGDSARIVLSGNELIVEEERAHAVRRLAVFRQDLPFPGRSFSVTAVMKGRQLEVSVDDGPVLSVDGFSPPAMDKGMLQLSVTEKTRGAARAEIGELEYEPLGSTVHNLNTQEQGAAS